MPVDLLALWRALHPDGSRVDSDPELRRMLEDDARRIHAAAAAGVAFAETVVGRWARPQSPPQPPRPAQAQAQSQTPAPDKVCEQIADLLELAGRPSTPIDEARNAGRAAAQILMAERPELLALIRGHHK